MTKKELKDRIQRALTPDLFEYAALEQVKNTIDKMDLSDIKDYIKEMASDKLRTDRLCTAFDIFVEYLGEHLED